jgi:tRNA A-37 threonylcarbamoyl transferase component Bud32
MLVETRAREGAARVERVTTDKGIFWIKRPENPSWRYRLQKGDPRNAFERERTGFHDLNGAQAPAPRLVAEGPDFLVLPDCGPNLRQRLATQQDAGIRRDLLMDAARSLGALHGLGFAHGRPSPKDMCRSGEQELLLDFERYDRRNNTLKGQARDLVIWVFNVAAMSPQMRDDLPEALDVHSENAPSGVRGAAEDLCRKLVWANWLTKPIQMRSGNKAREFKAIPVVLDLFGSRL